MLPRVLRMFSVSWEAAQVFSKTEKKELRSTISQMEVIEAIRKRAP